jgi:hypothetical protein
MRILLVGAIMALAVFGIGVQVPTSVSAAELPPEHSFELPPEH